jgi:hypothetical protein
VTNASDAAEVTAQRIDELLAELRARPDPRAAAVAEELTCCLVQLYGAGLERIAARLGPVQVLDLCGDPLVEACCSYTICIRWTRRRGSGRPWSGPGGRRRHRARARP